MLAAAARYASLTWDDLAPGQQEVLFALACGLSDQAIAEALGMSLPAVRSTITGLYQTLHISDRIEAILWALNHDTVAAEVLATV